MYRWLAADAEFRAAVESAEAKAESYYVTIIHEAARDDWRAAAWWLERRRPDSYARRERFEAHVRAQAERLANANGLDSGDVLATAEDIVEHGWESSVGDPTILDDDEHGGGDA